MARAAARKTGTTRAQKAPAPSCAPTPGAAYISSAAQRAGWRLSVSRAEQLAAAAELTLKIFEDVAKRLDFDSDAVSYLAIRDSVKQNEGA